jgi:hypothetical protein
VLELVEVPGIGGVMKLITSVVRTPFRLVTTLFDRLWTSVENSRGDRQGEYAILLELFTQWLAALEAAAQTAAHRYPHPAWVTIVTACGSEDFRQQLRRNFEHVYASYRQAVEQEVQRRTQEIYQTIAQRPALLQTLRGVNLAVDAATMLIVVKSAGVDWSDAVIGPLMAGFRRVLVEAGMGVYLDTQQRLLKQRQFEILHQLAWTQLAQAVRELFPAEESASAVNAARRDVALLAEAVRHIAGEKTASETWG